MKKMGLALGLAAVVSLGVGGQVLSGLAEPATAATTGMSVSQTFTYDSYPKLNRYGAYNVPVQLWGQDAVNKRYGAGELVVTVELPGVVKSVEVYPGWKATHEAGTGKVRVVNTAPVEVGNIGSFFAFDAFGSFEKFGTARVSVNEPGLRLESDVAPLILG